MPRTVAEARAHAHAYALALPTAFEDHPWGETVVKVKVGSKPKIFVFLGHADDATGAFGIGLKLPVTGLHALDRADAEPTGYGLGKSGWVSFRFVEIPETAQMEAWILESFVAVAPKKVGDAARMGR